MFNTIKVNNTDTNYTHSIFDISEYNSGAKYDDLSQALAAVPLNLQKGGMTVAFVSNSDNKYVQARCMAESFTIDVTQWQGVDDKPTYQSKNTVESSGVYDCINNVNIVSDTFGSYPYNFVTGQTYIIRNNGSSTTIVSHRNTPDGESSDIVRVSAGAEVEYTPTSDGKYLRYGDACNLLVWIKGTIIDKVNALEKTDKIIISNNGYFVCDSGYTSNIRRITVANYERSVGGSIKIKMTNNILVASSVTLSIIGLGSQDYQATLYYEDAPASKDNTWEAGEIVEVFYDGTYYRSYKFKNIVVDKELTKNSKNAACSGDVYEKTSILSKQVINSFSDISECVVSENMLVNSGGDLSSLNGYALLRFTPTNRLFPVLAGSTIKANSGYKFNYVVKEVDYLNASGYIEKGDNITSEVTIEHDGFLGISASKVTFDPDTPLTHEEAVTLVNDALDINLILNLPKDLTNFTLIDPKNLPWVYGFISYSGRFEYTRTALVLREYIPVKAGSVITCEPDVQVQVMVIDKDGEYNYTTYSSSYVVQEDCKIRFGIRYYNTATIMNFSILNKISVYLKTDEEINRFDKRNYLNYYDIPSGVYRGCHVEDTGLNESTVDYDDFIAPWDALVENSNGYVTKKDLGVTYDSKHLYCYRFGIDYDKPNRLKPIIYMHSTVHGHEKSATIGAYYLMKDIVEHYSENPVLQYLRDNVIIKVIPAANVYGIMNNLRYNFNEVNINRNYPAYSWSTYTPTPGDMNNNKGTAPLSEPTTLYLVEELLSEAGQTALAIDIHTDGRPFDSNYSYSKLLSTWYPVNYFGKYDFNVRDILSAFHSNMRGIFDSYGVGGSATDIYGELRVADTTPQFQTWLNESTDILGGTLEVPCGHASVLGSNLTPYSTDTIKCCAEIIGNYIIQMLRGLSK